jgi:hypothetical protein
VDPAHFRAHGPIGPISKPDAPERVQRLPTGRAQWRTTSRQAARTLEPASSNLDAARRRLALWPHRRSGGWPPCLRGAAEAQSMIATPHAHGDGQLDGRRVLEFDRVIQGQRHRAYSDATLTIEAVAFAHGTAAGPPYEGDVEVMIAHFVNQHRSWRSDELGLDTTRWRSPRAEQAGQKAFRTRVVEADGDCPRLPRVRGTSRLQEGVGPVQEYPRPGDEALTCPGEGDSPREAVDRGNPSLRYLSDRLAGPDRRGSARRATSVRAWRRHDEGACRRCRGKGRGARRPDGW